VWRSYLGPFAHQGLPQALGDQFIALIVGSMMEFDEAGIRARRRLSGKYILNVVACLLLDTVGPGIRRICGRASRIRINANKCVPNSRRHELTVAADVNLSAVSKLIHDVGAIMPDAMLDISHPTLRCGRESWSHADDTRGLPSAKITAIELIDLGMVTSKRQQRRAYRLGTLRKDCASLYEARKWRQSGPGTHH
jgi:hypothetical protein